MADMNNSKVNRFDFPDGIVRVTAGRGSECLLVFGPEKTVLMDTGMPFLCGKLIDNIKGALREKGRDKLDYVTLSHTHYDHIGAVTPLTKAWPDLKVIAAGKAAKVFKSEGARKTMDRLAREAAAHYSETLEEGWLDLLRVDIEVKDGDRIDLGGGKYLAVLETKGHTDCSLTFVLEPGKIMFSSESTGVMRKDGFLSSEIVKSYDDAIESAVKCIRYGANVLITPHYGVMPEKDGPVQFFVWFMIAAWRKRKFVLDTFDETKDLDKTVDIYCGKYWNDEWNDGQPKAAFIENAKYAVRNMLLEAGRKIDG